MLKKVLALICLVMLPQMRASHVVINEIMYHPANDRDDLQFIELYNPTTATVDLSGWQLAGGVKFVFPPKAALPAGGYVVVAQDGAALQRAHNSTIRVIGNFTGHLSHKGEKLQLLDQSGQVVEKLHFHDKVPWPLGPDGYGSSLERICVEVSAEEGSNWEASHGLAGGTPGEQNSVFSAKPLPVIQNIQWTKFTKPGQAIEVSAEISGGSPVQKVVLQYRTLRSARQSSPAEVQMHAAAGGASGRYTAEIPAQTAGTLVRFTIQATDQDNLNRLEPGSAEPRPAFAAYVAEAAERGPIPLVTVINPEALRGGGNKFGPSRKAPSGPGKSAVVYVPAKDEQGEPQLFDFVNVRRRAGGLKIHFLKDQRLAEMTGINVIFEGPPRWVLAEHLAYELYRKAGMNIEKSGHVRLTVDGRSLGYYLYVEQPNKNFLTRSGRDETGNVYKVLWFGRNIVDQNEKKTNPGTGHDDIIKLIQTLRQKTGAAQWSYINEQFNVDAFANYYAVNLCLENWDGYFNNHFLYHDLNAGGKWDVIPWDEDKTWGEYDGGPRDYAWYDMPLTYGSNDDRQGSSSWFGSGPFGGGGNWWRPAGMISGPLLSNPQFKQKMLARLRELCTTVFTPEQFGPVVEALQQRLRPEVEIKARATGQDPASALRQFDAEIASFQRQLVNRRKFILAQLGK